MAAKPSTTTRWCNKFSEIPNKSPSRPALCRPGVSLPVWAVRKPGRCKDLTSQVFLEALQALPRYRPQGAFPAWLFSIARCRAIDRGRKSRENFSLAWIENLPAPEGDPLSEVIQAEELHRLAELYDRLVQPKQELIRLRFAADLTYGQIAKVLGRNEAAVGMAIKRLLNELNRSWEE